LKIEKSSVIFNFFIQMKIDAKRVDGEQRRKNMEEEGKQAKYKAEYQVIK
jgi:hypothetical protein